MHDIVRGLLTGDASLGGARAALVEIQSIRYRHIGWLHDRLGWLSRGITVTEREDTQNGVLYRLKTMSHPDLDRYWTIDEYDLSPRKSLRVVYACDGNLSFAGKPRTSRRVAFRAAGSRDALQTALDDYGIRSTYTEDDRVSVISEDVGKLLELVAPPTPGSEYKWADNLTEYADIKDAVESVERDYADWGLTLLQD